VRSFSTPGTKTVRVQVTDASGATAIAARTVTVANLNPIARFSYSPTAPQKNQAVTFTSSSSDRDGSIARTEWDFNGDGAWDKTGASVQNTFIAVGLYTVRLRVTDNSGASDEFAVALSVGGNAAPAASISIAPESPLTGQTVTFTAQSSDPDGAVERLEWDLDGDGSFDDGGKTSMTMQYPTPGTRVIGLRVTDNEGANGFAQRQIAVGNRSPQASFTASATTPLRGQLVCWGGRASRSCSPTAARSSPMRHTSG
jgi:PKD repeat protein